MDRFCSKCGKEIGGDDVFCGKCGKKLVKGDDHTSAGGQTEELTHTEANFEPIGGPTKYIVTCIKKYVDGSGRARRAEYWYLQLFLFFGLIMTAFLDTTFFPAYVTANDGTGPLYIAFVLVMLLPSIAVAVRRLHDTGRSGWHLLLGLIPLLGGIIVLIFFLTDSDKDNNKYGPNPKLKLKS